MKNEYAFNSEHKLVHITDVEKSKKQIFTCCNCGCSVIPKKGTIRRYHFAHAQETNCSYESYLHKVGKLKFFEEYQKCLTSNSPFYVEYKFDETCNTCIKPFDIDCKLETKINCFDLTKKFDMIAIEKSFDGFIADILLKSSKSNEVIFIEFAVSHKCEERKISSGNRIIEINLTDDSDLVFINEKKIKQKGTNTTFYNFKTKHFTKNFFNNLDCKNLFDVYIVYKNNKTIKITEQMRNIIHEINNENVMFFKIGAYENRKFDFEDFAINYSFINPKYKNCFACRFFDENNSYNSYQKYFCKRLKKGIDNSNFGYNCDKFWRVEKHS